MLVTDIYLLINSSTPAQQDRYELVSATQYFHFWSTKMSSREGRIYFAGVEGVEPSSQVLETRILPLYYTPK